MRRSFGLLSALFLGGVMWLSAQTAQPKILYPRVLGTMVIRENDNELPLPHPNPSLTPVEQREDGNADSYQLVEGSGPLTIDFRGEALIKKAALYSWEVSDQPDYSNRLMYQSGVYSQVLPGDTTYSTPVLRYTFERSGTEETPMIYYVRMSTSLADGSAPEQTNSYQVKVYTSKLDCPNVFTPGSDGKNDEFKVVFRSIKSFRGTIFNRMGVRLFDWTDPSLSWDGRFGGKPLPTGVYFYVIEAEGTDGQKFRLKGDLNLFREN